MRDAPEVACYVRSSTEKQSIDHQHSDITEWGEECGINPASIDRHVDLSQSGTDLGREQFKELIDGDITNFS